MFIGWYMIINIGQSNFIYSTFHYRETQCPFYVYILYTGYCPWKTETETVFSCQTEFNWSHTLHRISPTLWACRSCMNACLWALWPRTGSCSSWLPSWTLMEPWETPVGAWTPSRTSCSSSSDPTSPLTEQRSGRWRDENKGIAWSNLPSPLSPPCLSSGLFEAEEEEELRQRNYWRRGDWEDAKMEHEALQYLLVFLLALFKARQLVFRKSGFRRLPQLISSHIFLPTRLVLLTGEEEVQSEEDEDRRRDSRMKVCSWSLWLRTTVFTSCQWFRLWTSLNVNLW